MFKKLYHRKQGGGTYVPNTYMNRYQNARKQRYGSHNATSSLLGGSKNRCYYGGKRHRNRRRHHRHYWRHLFPQDAEEDEKVEKEKEAEKEKRRIEREKAKTLEALTVSELNLKISSNAFLHRTKKYKKVKGEDADAVLRRGQEFTVRLKFNRPYNKEKDDLFFVVSADEENETPGKNLHEQFQLDEDNTGTYKEDKEWGARIVKDEGRKFLEVAIYIPPDCVIGEWDLNIKTTTLPDEKEYVYEHEQNLFILFNPWCKEDTVYFEKESELDEYIFNDKGAVYSGCASSIGSRSWTYGQFEEGILETSMDILKKAFGFTMSPQMADPIMVSRALSSITNACNNDGVLVGNWSGNYEGGERPTNWNSSVSVLNSFNKTGEPVKYGQCWVFSHVLTTGCDDEACLGNDHISPGLLIGIPGDQIMLFQRVQNSAARALGLPCRSVTNFDSAHDTDNTCTIDYYYRNGEQLTNMKTDSIWNFHVWNEVWMRRPDLGKTNDGESYDGWHVIDATPQEQSLGVFQCGPCPLKAVKRGEINVGFDTAFVFSEVNAAVVHWIVDDCGEIIHKSALVKNSVGTKPSTKPPDGKPLKKRMNYHCLEEYRLDLTDEYKFPPNSAEYFESLKRAIRFTRHGDKLFKQSQDLEVTFDMETQVLVGQDFVVKAFVKNMTDHDKEVEVLMSCRTCRYWNNENDDKYLVKEDKPKITVKPGQYETFQVTLPFDLYMTECDENLNFYAYVCATDLENMMPFSAQNPFRLRRPDLEFDGPEECDSDKDVCVDIYFENPLDIPLTHCKLQMMGNLEISENDQNPIEGAGFFMKETYCQDVEPKGKFKATMVLKGHLDDEDEECKNMYMDFDFKCEEFSFLVSGSCCIDVHGHH